LNNEPAAQLIESDRQFHPTKVVFWLGTNDLSRDLVATQAAMTKLRDTYRAMGADVWAIGPPMFVGKAESYNAKTPGIYAVMAKVFGKAKLIDSRPLALTTDRTGDGVHFTQTSAKPTAVAVATKLLSTNPYKAPILGGLAVFAGVLLVGIVVHAVRKKKLGPIGMLIEPRLVGPALMALDAKRQNRVSFP
jgi:hypothetical protein